MKIEALQSQILEAALPHVVFDGWSEEILRRAAEDAGLTALDAYRAFPEGVTQLVDYFCASNDQKMLAIIDRSQFNDLRVRDKIATLVWARLEAVAPHREVVRHTLAHYAFPLNAARGMKRLYDTVSLMWYEAGDKATDWNFYSKRTLLAGVYSSTLLYWLDDQSEGFGDTRAFLERRINEVLKIPALKQKFKKQCQSWMPRHFPFMP